MTSTLPWKLAAKDKADDPRLNAQILNSFGVIHYRQKKMDKAASSLVQAAAVPSPQAIHWTWIRGRS